MKKNYLKTFIATLLMAVGSINAQAEGLSLTQNGTSTYLLPANASTADGISSFSDNPFTGGAVQKGTNVTAFYVSSSTNEGVAEFSEAYTLADREEVTISFVNYNGWVGGGKDSQISITNSEGSNVFSYTYNAGGCNVTSVSVGTTTTTTTFSGQGVNANGFTGNGKPYSTDQTKNLVVTVVIKKSGNITASFVNPGKSVNETFEGSLGEGKVDLKKINFTSGITNNDRASGITNLTLSSTISTVATANYTIKYTDKDGNAIKEITKETYVGEKYTASDADMQTFFSEDGKKKYIYNSGNEEKTAVEAAEENVITLVFDTYDKFSYTVTGKAGDTDLGTIASGEAYTDNKTVTYLNKYIKIGDKWYMTEAPYSIIITNIKNEIIYTEADIDYFYEAEDLGYANKDIATGDNYSNGQKAAIESRRMATLGTFPAGKYMVTAYVTNDGNRGFFLRNTANTDNTTNEIAKLSIDKNTNAGEYSVEMTLTESTSVGISGYTNTGDQNRPNQSAGIDYIYIKKTAETVSLPYEYNTYRTQSALDFTGNEDVEAYTAEMNGEGTAVTLTQVYQVPEGAGVILKRKGEATTANVNIITSADELSGNQLKGVKTAMQAAELVAENAYILVDQLFCRVTESSEGELAAGKAYLAVPANVKAAATLSLGFGNITGATEVEAQAKATAGEIYNMQGMRVKSATKGIYIIGGKKYCF